MCSGELGTNFKSEERCLQEGETGGHCVGPVYNTEAAP